MIRCRKWPQSTFNKISKFHFGKYLKIKQQQQKQTNKQIVSCESSSREVSFEWSHCRISSTNSKVTLQSSHLIQDSAMAIKGLRERRNICTVSLSRAEINQICSAFQTREHFPWFCITVIFSCGLASEKNKTLKDLLVSSPSARPNFVIQYRSKGS